LDSRFVILPLLKIIFDGTKVMISMKTNDIPGSVLETNPPSAQLTLRLSCTTSSGKRSTISFQRRAYGPSSSSRADGRGGTSHFDESGAVPCTKGGPILVSGSTSKTMGSFLRIVRTLELLTYSTESVISQLDCQLGRVLWISRSLRSKAR
jgi:hypothetical protein